jgi:penicillin-binding protein 1C
VRLREALGSSYNVPAVYAANEVGIARVLGRLRDIGLDTLDREADFYGPALALGDGEVRLWDLVAAYASIARGGMYRPLRSLRSAPLGAKRRVMSAESAAMIADVLADNSARIAAFGEHSALELPSSRGSAGAVVAKTGTSKGYRDNWTIGFTDDVTVGVWVGNFDGSPMREVSGITGAAPLFRMAMSAAMRAHEGSHERARLPDTLGHAKVCALSGGAPHAGCKHVVDEIVPKSHSLAPCDMHLTIAGKTYERFDGPFAAWAKASGRDTHPPPIAGFRAPDSGLRIRYPRDGARFVLDPDRPRSAQAIPLKVDASGSTEVKVYVDGRLAARSRGGESAYWTLQPGAHTIVAESGGTRSDLVSIRVD